MIKYLQLPLVFDVAAMQSEVKQLGAEFWKLHYQKLHYEGEWTAIALRSPGGKTDNIIISPTREIPYEDTALLDGCNYFKNVLAHIKCPLLAVRLLKLQAGAVIKEHRDAELNFENGEIRIHIPVITHPDVEFFLDKERLMLKEGECWYMNFNLPHNINNKSNIDRIHLVIDAVVNDWVKETFSDPAIQVKKEAGDASTKYSEDTKRQMIQHLRSINSETSNRMADEIQLTIDN